MNHTAKLALWAAAAVVVALLGITFLLPGGPSTGGPDPSVAPEPSLAPDPTPTALRAADPLEPGTYVAHPLVSNPSLAVTFTAPEGWQAYDARTLVPLGDDSTQGPDGAALVFGEISGIYSDPCESLGDPDVDGGTTAEDLAAAFSAQAAYEASVADVSVSGYSGKQVEFQLPSEFDESCPRDELLRLRRRPLRPRRRQSMASEDPGRRRLAPRDLLSRLRGHAGIGSGRHHVDHRIDSDRDRGLSHVAPRGR